MLRRIPKAVISDWHRLPEVIATAAEQCRELQVYIPTWPPIRDCSRLLLLQGLMTVWALLISACCILQTLLELGQLSQTECCIGWLCFYTLDDESILDRLPSCLVSLQSLRIGLRDWVQPSDKTRWAGCVFSVIFIIMLVWKACVIFCSFCWCLSAALRCSSWRRSRHVPLLF